MNRKAFVFYGDWMESLSEYPSEVRLEVYEAAIRYALSGTLSELKPISKMAFSFIKRQIDYDNEKYNNVVRSRSNAGRKGNEKRWQKSQTSQNIANIANATLAINDIANIAYIDKDKELDKDINNSIVPKGNNMSESSPEHSDEETEEQKEEIKNSLICEKVREYYNDAISKNNSLMPKAVSIKNQRMQFVLLRVKEYGIENVFKCIDNATNSTFLSGDNKNGFKADIGWIMRPNNFPKVLEGKYSNRNAKGYEVGMILNDNSEDKFKNAKGW